MKKLWAPWRMDYILEPKSDDECFICDILKDKEQNDKKNLILFRGKVSLVILNAFPYNNGHIMVAPNKHTSELIELSPEISAEMWELTAKSVEVLKAAIKPEGFNIGINLGQVAGAGLKTHLHIHIVPRWNGDTNYMPVLGSTKIISQALEETYDKLCEFIDIFKH
ncbi:MAG: HIT domain-containing protein [Asgard group archaeon]|nr:HIT domain-containing protein [Asgard group archaeon]